MLNFNPLIRARRDIKLRTRIHMVAGHKLHTRDSIICALMEMTLRKCDCNARPHYDAVAKILLRTCSCLCFLSPLSKRAHHTHAYPPHVWQLSVMGALMRGRVFTLWLGLVVPLRARVKNMSPVKLIRTAASANVAATWSLLMSLLLLFKHQTSAHTAHTEQ